VAAPTSRGCRPGTAARPTCTRRATGFRSVFEAFPGRERNDLVLWIESRRAVVAGDALVDFGRGLEIPQESLTKCVTREQVLEGLRPLLALPVEVVLPAHGAPTDRAALERALSL
jgi:glyoxylase-like metal-dependent hydrolase (beta-lactamase superfamily II)